MKISNIFFNVIKYFAIFIKLLCKKIYQWTLHKIDLGLYRDVYVAYGFLVLIVSLYIVENGAGISILLICTIAILVALQVKIYRELLDYERTSEEYFYHMTGWWFATTYYSLLILIHFVEMLPKNLINLTLISFFILFYYWSRFLFIKWVKHWLVYILLFFLIPIISVTIYSFLGIFLYEITGEKFFISNSMLGWMVIFLSILLINIVVYWTPQHRFDEVKVAIYFLLAFFSSISYCFFISDYLTTFITPKLINIPGFSAVTTNDVKIFIEQVVKWVSLPYLIGSVFASFSIEYVSRRRKRSSNSLKIATSEKPANPCQVEVK